MPNVLEIKETRTEVQELPVCRTPQPVRTLLCGLGHTVTEALKSIRHSKHTDQRMVCPATWEMPLDTLARKHPYMYTDTLL